MAALTNASASEIDKTSYWWTGLCGICHPGGGPSEYDRDGDLYYDVVADQMGYEARGETDAQQEFDGDYSEVSNSTGLEIHPAPWDVTGVLEPDCLYCHRSDRMIDPGSGAMLNWVFRAAVLRKKAGLVDAASGASVPAFAAAPTAAMGWGTVVLGSPPPGKPPIADTFDIDYSLGVTGGSLTTDADGNLRVAASALQGSPPDYACWGCHVIADDKKRGRVWFDATQDVHYAAFNLLNDGDATNDIMPAMSTACTQCHEVTGNMADRDREHNIGKGNANLGSARNDTDWVGFQTCRDCHDGTTAPAPTSGVHTANAAHDKMACQFCHIPYKADNAQLVVDNATTGSTIGYNTDDFLTSDQVNPGAGDTTRWYPSATVRQDKDGVMRIFPAKLLLSMWWGDWADANNDDLPDAGELISAMPLWQIRPIAGAQTPTDDNGDGKPEVNTDAEITAYLLAIRAATDVHGNPVATNPILAKGGKIYFLGAGDVLGHFEYEGTGILVESSHPFSIDHNVLAPAGTALGSSGCAECHASFGAGTVGPVFDRAILVDTNDNAAETTGGAADGAVPVYETLKDMIPQSYWPNSHP